MNACSRLLALSLICVLVPVALAQNPPPPGQRRPGPPPPRPGGNAQQSAATAPAPKAATPPTAADAAEIKLLEGTWVGRVANPGVAGNSGKGSIVTFSEVVIKDGQIKAKGERGGDMGTGTYRLNAASKQLDSVGTGGQYNGKSFTGIYRLNGDNLEWCVANPGIPRPTDYFTKQQVQFHLVLTRKK